jgi:hypothetical protein
MGTSRPHVVDTLLDSGDKKKPFDPKEMDRLIDDCPENQRPNASFFVAGLLKNHGQTDMARKRYDLRTDSANLWEWYRCIARDAIKSMTNK